MGCFDHTCAISGLPIGPGEKVRCILLSQNPYHRGRTANRITCYPTDIWFPRTFPLQAKYDHYGSVEEVQGGPQAAAWLAGLQLDLVQKGWGNNAAHDVPTRKAMTLEELFSAVREGRIHVASNYDPYRPKRVDVPADLPADSDLAKLTAFLNAQAESRPSIPEGIPTRQRVECALTARGHKLAKSYHDGLLVSRVDANTVRVRAGDGVSGLPRLDLIDRFRAWAHRRLPKPLVACLKIRFPSRENALRRIQRVLAKRWAGMVCGGSDGSSNEAELLLRPLPGVRRHCPEKREAPLCVALALIREDVWQAICALPIAYAFDPPTTADRARAACRATWDDFVGAEPYRRELMGMMQRSCAHMVTNDAIPFTVGLGSHWNAMVAAWERGEVSEAEREDFLSTAGELIHVSIWLSATRYQWHPSSSSGPQCGEWAAHASLLEAFHTIAARLQAEQEATWE